MKLLRQIKSIPPTALIFGAVGVLLVGLAAFGPSISSWFRGGSAVVSAPVEATGPVYRHPLTGEKIDAPLAELPFVYTVMVDHSVDAWPQSGVDQAFLVIEAPVEAGIPRLETFFYAEQDVPKIGPVRSARPYFIDWADEFRSLYVHVGGSPEALGLIAKFGTFDFNEFAFGNYFWRARDRVAPHNAYTSMELLTEGVAKKFKLDAGGNIPDHTYEMWTFKENGAVPTEAVPSVQVDAASPSYGVIWVFDPAKDAYKRLQGGLPYAMQDGTIVEVNNVVIIEAHVEVVDGIGRRHITTVGGGDAVLLQDGKTTQITWKKETRTSRLRFYDAAGAEIAMNAGHTWIQVVPGLEWVYVLPVSKGAEDGNDKPEGSGAEY